MNKQASKSINQPTGKNANKKTPISNTKTLQEINVTG